MGYYHLQPRTLTTGGAIVAGAAAGTVAATAVYAGAFTVKDQFGNKITSGFDSEIETTALELKGTTGTTSDIGTNLPTLEIDSTGQVTLTFKAYDGDGTESVKTTDVYENTTSYGTFTLSITKGGVIGDDEVEYSLTFKADKHTAVYIPTDLTRYNKKASDTFTLAEKAKTYELSGVKGTLTTGGAIEAGDTGAAATTAVYAGAFTVKDQFGNKITSGFDSEIETTALELKGTTGTTSDIGTNLPTLKIDSTGQVTLTFKAYDGDGTNILLQ